MKLSSSVEVKDENRDFVSNATDATGASFPVTPASCWLTPLSFNLASRLCCACAAAFLSQFIVLPQISIGLGREDISWYTSSDAADSPARTLGQPGTSAPASASRAHSVMNDSESDGARGPPAAAGTEFQSQGHPGLCVDGPGRFLCARRPFVEAAMHDGRPGPGASQWLRLRGLLVRLRPAWLPQTDDLISGGPNCPKQKA